MKSYKPKHAAGQSSEGGPPARLTGRFRELAVGTVVAAAIAGSVVALAAPGDNSATGAPAPTATVAVSVPTPLPTATPLPAPTPVPAPILDPECADVVPDPFPLPTTGTATEVLADDFGTAPLGPLAVDYLEGPWHAPEWTNGVDNGRVAVVDDADGNRALSVTYPADSFGAGRSGAQWPSPLPTADAMHLTYRVRFADDFDFVLGGKLPGLAGGEANTGGEKPNGNDGWSARLMWRENGCAEFYVYHPDQPRTFGDDLRWPVRFEPGVWHQVDEIVVMNTAGEYDGVILGWLDGRLMFERRDLRFRQVDAFAIDLLYFSTFFGGGDSTWAPASDQSIEFDDFLVRLVDPSAANR